MIPTLCRTFGAFTLGFLIANSSFAKEITPAARQQQPPPAAVDQGTTAVPEDPVTAPDDLPPHGDKLRMADVCRLSVEKDRLVLHTRMPANRQVQTLDLPIEGLRGSNTIRVERDESPLLPAATMAEEPALFYLVNNDTDAPDASLVQTQISLTGGQLLVHQHVQTRDGWRVISLSQGGDANNNANADAPTGPNVVSLTVTRGNAPDRRVHCVAPDWTTFRRCFAREINLYVRPLLRTMRQDGVFAVDANVAWQVFRDEWRIDPQVSQRIASLLPKFEADDFATRNKAWKALCSEGIAGALYLNDFDTAKLTPEQAARIDSFLAMFPLLDPDEVAADRIDPNFMLDCLYGPDDEVREIALRRLGMIMHADVLPVPTGGEEAMFNTIAQWRTQIPVMNLAQAETR